ncbi:hypothetical protein DL764_002156 [Monosporascus ibericus]|uniref:Uncharacterized protein n=1 Tax=Monosporascus ibericus TaxID=155417 RepID=A0A4Q4TQX7_9PEZI|nr:hypothetical protein DL764_002156 [Monosporascus ibericus]
MSTRLIPDELRAAGGRCVAACHAFNDLSDVRSPHERVRRWFNLDASTLIPFVQAPVRREYVLRMNIHPSAFVDRCCIIVDTPTAGALVGARVVVGLGVCMYAGDRGIVIGDGALIGGGVIIIPYAPPQPRRQPEIEPEREGEEKPDDETQIEGRETGEPVSDEEMDDTDGEENVEEYIVEEVLDSRLSGEGLLQYSVRVGGGYATDPVWHPKKPGPPEDFDIWERAFTGDG